jgi:hypothetical protein
MQVHRSNCRIIVGGGLVEAAVYCSVYQDHFGCTYSDPFVVTPDDEDEDEKRWKKRRWMGFRP